MTVTVTDTVTMALVLQIGPFLYIDAFSAVFCVLSTPNLYYSWRCPDNLSYLLVGHALFAKSHSLFPELLLYFCFKVTRICFFHACFFTTLRGNLKVKSYGF